METTVPEDVSSPSMSISHLRTAVDIFVSLVPEKDFKFASHWFATFMQQKRRDLNLQSKRAESQGWSVEAMLKGLPELVTHSLSRLADQAEMKKQREIWQSLCGTNEQGNRPILLFV